MRIRMDIDSIVWIKCLGDMTRAWRREYEDVLYHVLSHGDERRDIFTA